MSWLHDMTTEFLGEVERAKEHRVYPFFRPFENIGTRVKIGGGSYINFTSNDYLGLSQDPRLIARAHGALDKYGTGLGSARMQATSDRHEVLERDLARWLGRQACATATTGYQAMVGLLSTFADDDTLFVLDKLSHACMVDGANLAHGQNPDMEVRYFKHNNPDSLRKILAESDKKKKLVLVEGLYSVDGDLAPLPALIEVCRKHGAVLAVDDAHGIGALGPTGRGTAELQGVLADVDLLYGSFSKCFGGIGGFWVADQPIIDYLRLRGKSFVYSASLPVAQTEAAITALEIIRADRSYQKRLEDNRDFFRAGLSELGFDLGLSTTHISPIMVGDEMKTLAFAAYLYHLADVIMMPFIYPGVPPGKGRLRCNVTAAHDRSDMGYTLEALAMIGRKIGVLKRGARTKQSWSQKAKWVAEHKWRSFGSAGLTNNLRHDLGKIATAISEARKPKSELSL